MLIHSHRSVATAMAFLRLKGFENMDSEATEEFVLWINSVFDILNSRSTFAIGHRSPLRPENHEAIFFHLQTFCEYLMTVRHSNGEVVAFSRRKMGILGFLVACHSLKELYFRHFIKYPYFMTYRLSQDHLELLFNVIRRKGGWNNNPSARALKAIFRGVLFGSGCQATNNGNVIPLVETPSPDEFSDDNKFPVEILYLTDTISELKKTVIAYIAGWVITKVKEKMDCELCNDSLITMTPMDPEYSLIHFKNQGGLKYPSKDLLLLLTTCEKLFLQKLKYERIMIAIHKKFGKIGTLFSNLEVHHLETCHSLSSHYNTLIQLSSETYLHVRCHHESKLITQKTISQRKKLTKLILFKNQ